MYSVLWNKKKIYFSMEMQINLEGDMILQFNVNQIFFKLFVIPT